MQPSRRPLVTRSGDEDAGRGSGKDESGPRQHRERRVLPGRPEVPLKPDRQPVDPLGGPDDRRQHGQAERRRQNTPPPANLETPRAPRSGRPATMAGPMMLRMSTRKMEIGQPPGLRRNAWTRKMNARMKISSPRCTMLSHAVRRLARAPRGPFRRQHERHARQPQKQWRGESADDRQVAKGGGRSFSRQRPGVEDVRQDHDQHGEATRPINGPPPLNRRPAISHGQTSRRSSMSCRNDCQTEQYLSRDSAMARSIASCGASLSTTKCNCTRTSRLGSSSARSADRCAVM